MDKIIIGLVGFKGSGKGTVGEHLKYDHGFVDDSFAEPLKDIVATLFNWPRHLLEGDTKESREWRETVDEYWAHKLDWPGFTPRIAMQRIGTDTIRKNFHDLMWVYLMEKRIQDNRANAIVVTDCRFVNEMKLVQKLGGSIIRVKRGPEPEWWETAIKANQGDTEAQTVLTDKYEVHPSESDWIGYPVDWVIENEGTVEDLCLQVNNALDKLLEKA